RGACDRSWTRSSRSRRPEPRTSASSQGGSSARSSSGFRRDVRPSAIDHVVIAVTDWDRSNAFYRDVLGAEVRQEDPFYGQYGFGDWFLSVHGPGFDGLNAARPVAPGNVDLCFVWPASIEDAVA